jgi:hypothetical protein
VFFDCGDVLVAESRRRWRRRKSSSHLERDSARAYTLLPGFVVKIRLPTRWCTLHPNTGKVLLCFLSLSLNLIGPLSRRGLQKSGICDRDERFEEEEHYEWFKDYSHFRDLLLSHVQPTDRVRGAPCSDPFPLVAEIKSQLPFRVHLSNV